MKVVGSLAGMIEASAMQPFLYWKTMEQINKPMVWKPSLAYRGVLINAASIAPISGLQYAANGSLQKLFVSMSGNERPGELQKLAVAIGAGAISSLIVTPAELIMISQQRLGGSVASTLKDVWSTSGLRGMMRGFAPTTWREMGWTGGLFGQWQPPPVHLIYYFLVDSRTLMDAPNPPHAGGRSTPIKHPLESVAS